ncbi:MAG: S8 family serine peptidase [Eggerthellaceae bacterium]|nr:S8 family serine peptidase [Eggerthellaceae bacterium]
MKSGFSIFQNGKRKPGARLRLAATSLSLTLALTLALGLGVGLAQAEDNAAANDVVATGDGAEGVAYEAGVVLVEFKEGTGEQEALETLSAETGLEGVEVAQVAGDYVELALPDGVSVADAVETFAQSGVVDAVQPNFIYYLMDDVPSQDEGAAAGDAVNASTHMAAGGLQAVLLQAADVAVQAGGIAINDTYASEQWALESVHAYEAWETTQVNGSVTVAVLDNLFNVNHEDLKGNIVASYNAVECKEDYDMMGENYTSSKKNHGTHVAGIVAAQVNNATGVAGVSHNACILPIRVASDDGTLKTASLVNAYNYILAHADEYNIRVVNMSMGASRDKTGWENAADDKLLKAIDEAWDAGIVTVTAAGNTSNPVSFYPGDYDKCVNVINLKNNDASDPSAVARSDSSNYNIDGAANKDVSAPGADIYSTLGSGNTAYGPMSGTSIAAPCVAGILALVFATTPSLTPEEAVSRLYSTATDLDAANDGFDQEYGYGEVNAYAAVKASAATIAGTTSMAVGGATTLVFTPDQNGIWTWKSSDESVVTVEDRGADAIVAGKDAGTATVGVYKDGLNGLRYAVATVAVYDPEIAGGTTVTYGNTLQLSLANPGNPVGVWNWTSSDESVAKVGASTGVVTPVKPGKTTITVTLNGNDAITSSIDITVKTIVLSDCSFAYTKSVAYAGHAVTLDDLAVTYAGKRLTAGKDYSIAYTGNTAVGAAQATVVGLGNCVGSVKLPFTIAKGQVTRASLSQTRFTYTGKAQKPSVTAFSGAVRLVEGRDFSVAYARNIGAGTAWVTIKGIGSYAGAIRLSFAIKKASSTLKVKAESPVVKRAKLDVGERTIARSRALAISGKKGALTYKKVGGSKYLSIGKKTGKIAVHRNTPCGTYKIKVRVRASGNANYKPANRTVVVKVRVK